MSSPRIHYCTLYNGVLSLFADTAKLGDSYKMYAPIPQDAKPLDDSLKFKQGQSAGWSSLPPELRCIIYDYAYADPFNPYRGFHLRVHRGKWYRRWFPKDIGDFPLGDDDMLVLLPRCVADRFISKQWLVETVRPIAQLKNWHLHCESESWKFALNMFTNGFSDTTTVGDLGRSVATVMFHHLSWLGLEVEKGDKISNHFNMGDFALCKSLEYIQMAHDCWWDEQFWIKSQLDDQDALTVVSLSEPGTWSIPNSINSLPRVTVNSLKTKYERSIYEDGGLPANMRDAIFDWSNQNEAFIDFKRMFREWKGPDSTFPSEFIVRSWCAIQDEPKRALCFEMRIETCERMLLRVFEGKNIFYIEEETPSQENSEQPVEGTVTSEQPSAHDVEVQAAVAVAAATQQTEQPAAQNVAAEDAAPVPTSAEQAMPEAPAIVAAIVEDIAEQAANEPTQTTTEPTVALTNISDNATTMEDTIAPSQPVDVVA